MQLINIIDKGVATGWPHSFIILMEILLWPLTLLTFRDLMIFNMFTLLKLIEESLAVSILSTKSLITLIN